MIDHWDGDVSIIHVKEHNSIVGNEKADRLPRYGAINQICTSFELPDANLESSICHIVVKYRFQLALAIKKS